MKFVDVRWVFLPYCLQRLADGRYVVLNRSYKPLGVQSSDFVDYESHPSAVALAITKAIAKKISVDGDDSLERIYLYRDRCIPSDSDAALQAYSLRLKVLMQLELKLD